MQVYPYQRLLTFAYAARWAYRRNPAFYNFDELGGDCTNFASQCIYAGSGVMNDTPTYGWYYFDLNNRSPSWTGVQYLYDFLTTNEGIGPFAEVVDVSALQVGDVLQLGHANGVFYHTPVVVRNDNGRIFVAAHTFDAFMRPLDTYTYNQARGLHIVGVRK